MHSVAYKDALRSRKRIRRTHRTRMGPARETMPPASMRNPVAKPQEPAILIQMARVAVLLSLPRMSNLD
jgi:hypothetical protein